MSLINDALKKARPDADRQEAKKRGDLYNAAPSHVPARKRIGLLGLLTMGILITAVVLLIQIPRLTTGPPAAQQPPPGDDAGSEADQSAAQPSAALSVVAPRPERTKSPPDPLEAPRPRSRRSPERTPDERVGSTNLEPSPARPRNRPDRQSRRIPARPSSQPQSETAPIDSVDGKSFLKKVRVPDGANLELSGIAWSDVHPVAVISGSIVGVGDFVEGFKVVKIEPNSVELQGDGSTFSIRLR